MNAYQEIQNTIYRIELAISEPLDISALAEHAHLSPYYFQRLFTRLVGRPIAEYQKQRRLARSLDMLRQDDARVIDVALELGFGSHETFTRAFKDAYETTPDIFRKCRAEGSGFSRVLTPDISLRHMETDEGVPLVSDGIIFEIGRVRYNTERIYAGYQIECSHKPAPNGRNPGLTWNYFDDKHFRTIPFLHSQGDHAGIVADGNESGFTYLAGCQVTQIDPAFMTSRDWPSFPNLPEYLSPGAVVLPRGDYITCTFTAESFGQMVEEALSRAGGVLWRHIKKHEIQTEGAWIEIYDDRANRWHPKYRMDDDAPHFASRKAKLSQGEGPEMEIQIKIKEDCV